MSRAVQTPIINPANRGTLDPNYHYVRVQIPDDKFDDSQLEDYVDPNGTDPAGHPMPVYEEVTRDRKATGSAKIALLRTPVEEFNKYQNSVVEKATRNLKPRSSEEKEEGRHIIGSFSRFETADEEVLV